jgi:uncharacterized protein YecE (DUF72 family)
MLRIGTSSWNYDSWEGLVYSRGSDRSYLEQYAEVFDTAEIDRWFCVRYRRDRQVVLVSL